MLETQLAHLAQPFQNHHEPPNRHLRIALSSLVDIPPPTACPPRPPWTLDGPLCAGFEAPAEVVLLPRRAPRTGACSLSSQPRFFGAGDSAVPFRASRKIVFLFLLFLLLKVDTAATSPTTFRATLPAEGPSSALSSPILPFFPAPLSRRSRDEERSAKRQYAARFRSSEPLRLLFFLALPLGFAVVEAAAAEAAAAATTLSPGWKLPRQNICQESEANRPHPWSSEGSCHGAVRNPSAKRLIITSLECFRSGGRGGVG